ncbi:hypothetical protein EVC45_37630 [Paraburkholderia sp. UYCP14C]|nr:hypothetical protein EVC45_37630 [Paraburkholderia sp. UYCP14C]
MSRQPEPIQNFNSLMVQLCEEEASGYNRKKDKIQQEERRQATRARGVSLRQFERLMFKAMAFHNLHADRSHLRDNLSLRAGLDGSPALNFMRSQEKRRGDARRKLSTREVFSRFVPWKPYTVRNGLVHFKFKTRYKSTELEKLWVEHMRIPKSDRGPLSIPVKRLEGSPNVLIWKMPNGEEGLRKIIRADRERIRGMRWAELDLTLESDSIRKSGNDQKRRVARDRVTVAQDEQISAAEAVREANGDIVEMEGASITDAKMRATAHRDRKWGEAQAAAAGIDTKQIVVPAAAQTSKSTAADEDYAARFRAKKLSRGSPPTATSSH